MQTYKFRWKEATFSITDSKRYQYSSVVFRRPLHIVEYMSWEIRPKSSWRWYNNTIADFLDITHPPDFI
jgi:hypothetical protein